jgi:4'-phosphopantetheinyl transferase EntD
MNDNRRARPAVPHCYRSSRVPGSLPVEQALIERLVPPEVSVIVGSPDASSAPLFAEEEAAVATALETRRREFSIGRRYAREAIRNLGGEAGPIPVRPDRGPAWPESVVGAITHTTGLVAAAVAWEEQIAGIGIDAESRDRPLKDSVDRFIRTDAERARMLLPRELDPLRLVFSAKESIHKCVAPISGITLGFHDVELDFDVQSSSFQARLVGRGDARLPDFHVLVGRFAVTPRFVITSAVITAMAHPPLDHRSVVPESGRFR